MKVNIKKVVKVGLVLAATYLFGRARGMNDVVVKYADNLDVDEVKIGTWTKSEKFSTIGRYVPKKQEVTEEATDAN